MKVKLRTDVSGITPRSVEEAGHAVMSAHLKMPFSKVRINSKTKPGQKGGSVDHIFDFNKISEAYIRKHALISMAGEAARRTLWSDAECSKTDRESVRWLYNHLAQKPPFKSLQEDADGIFAEAHLRQAIQTVAVILEMQHYISSREVKDLLRIAQNLDNE